MDVTAGLSRQSFQVNQTNHQTTQKQNQSRTKTPTPSNRSEKHCLGDTQYSSSECHENNIKPSDRKTPALELWKMRSTRFSPLFPGPLRLSGST